ncbi:MAG: DUF1080 domain-containing protein [Bryobacteraceae bacterium]|nr:DUF1080 domain-containing protein [Bryobacteraceae bacterium]
MRLFLLIPVFAASLFAGDWKNIMPQADLKGWTRLPIPPDPLAAESQWKVVDGLLVCEGDKGHDWLRYDTELGDFELELEFRYTPREGNPRYNSGIFVRNAADYSRWHQVQVGGASGGWIFGVTDEGGQSKRFNLREQLKEMRVKPAGEWNVVRVMAKGRTLTAFVNGSVVSEFSETGVARGHIGLEGEGYRIEFRNLRVREAR